MFNSRSRRNILMSLFALLLSGFLYLHAVNEIEKMFCIGSIGFWLYGLTVHIDKRNALFLEAYELLTISENYTFHSAIKSINYIKENRNVIVFNGLLVGFRKNENCYKPLECFLLVSNNYLHKFANEIMLMPDTDNWEKLREKILEDNNFFLTHPVTVSGKLSYIPIKGTNKGEFWITDAQVAW